MCVFIPAGLKGFCEIKQKRSENKMNLIFTYSRLSLQLMVLFLLDINFMTVSVYISCFILFLIFLSLCASLK